METSRTHELLRRVAVRQRVARLGARFLRFLLVVAAVSLVLFLASRLGGLLPDWFRPETLVVIPAAALVLAALTSRTPSEAGAARSTWSLPPTTSAGRRVS